MDRLLEQLKDVTHRMWELLPEASAEDMERFMERRTALFAQIQALSASSPLKEEHRAAVTRIVSLDERITARMRELKDEANEELTKLRMAKLKRNAYERSGFYDDSLFFDKRN